MRTLLPAFLAIAGLARAAEVPGGAGLPPVEPVVQASPASLRSPGVGRATPAASSRTAQNTAEAAEPSKGRRKTGPWEGRAEPLRPEFIEEKQPAEPRQPGLPVDALVDAAVSANSRNQPTVISATQGVTEIVPVSTRMNRFVVPFDNVSLFTDSENTTAKVRGRVVYVTPAAEEKAIALFLSEKGTDRAIALSLVPADIPPRDIYLRLTRPVSLPPPASPPPAGSAVEGNQHPHVAYIKEVMRDLALGRIPPGFSLLPARGDEFPCDLPGFSVRAGQVLEGAGSRVVVLAARNREARENAVDEQNCYKRGVLAVAAWPHVVVHVGGATEIFVMTRPEEVREGRDSPARPSLIGGTR